MTHLHVFISGGTQGLGKELVRIALAEGNRVSTFSRKKENVEALQSECASLDLKVMMGDIASPEAISRLVNDAINAYGPIDLIISNVGLFKWDSEFTRSIPEEDFHLSENELMEKYAQDTDFASIQKYYQFVQINYVGNARLIDEVIRLHTDKNLIIGEVGSVAVVANFIRKPLESSAEYGHIKAELIRHTKKRLFPHHVLRVVHPGPFGQSAQDIADRFGDTKGMETHAVAQKAWKVFTLPFSEGEQHRIIAPQEHFTREYFGDLQQYKHILPGIERTEWSPPSETILFTRREKMM